MGRHRHHEWLSLVPSEGPFLSELVLERVFPQGLDALDRDALKLARVAYEDWLAEPEDFLGVWVDWVLREILDFPEALLAVDDRIPEKWTVRVSQYGETLAPDAVVLGNGEGARPALFIERVDPKQALDRPQKGSRWSASPASRMAELLRGVGGAEGGLGLVTNGEHWMLVRTVPGESTTQVSWWASLWFDEPDTFRAFQTILGARRYFGVSPEESLGALIDASQDEQQEITDQLGLQVRSAIETLVQAIDRIDKDRNRELLEGSDPKELYQAVVSEGVDKVM